MTVDDEVEQHMIVLDALSIEETFDLHQPPLQLIRLAQAAIGRNRHDLESAIQNLDTALEPAKKIEKSRFARGFREKQKAPGHHPGAFLTSTCRIGNRCQFSDGALAVAGG
ncbi:MAG: hypothetical protein ACREIA_10610 [Opitutaceae bacterium]